jgi:flagellar hook-basal body complex protein FliE
MSVTPVSLYSDGYTSLNSINSLSSVSSAERADKATSTSGTSAFDTILNAAVDMYQEADSLQKSAESEEISFALGYTDSIHDLAVAQQKANISLQYTVKVTNAVVSAYKELMNMQL